MSILPLKCISWIQIRLDLIRIFGLPKTKVRQARLGSSTVTEEEEKQVSFISKPSQVGLKCYTDGT